MFYIVPFTNKCFKSIWTCCCDSTHMPSQNNPQLDCKWWHLCEPALILHYPALISPPQHDQFTFWTFRNNKRPWSCTTSQQGDIKGRNSKTARTAQAAKTRKLGQPRKTRKTKNAKTTKTTEDTKTVKTRKPREARKPENGETEETSSQLFAAFSGSFCFFLFLNFLVFSVFLVFSFSWFSPVFSCLCISSFWPQRANFLLRLCEPALISPPQQWSIYLPGYFWSSTKRPWSCTTFQQGTGWEEWFNRLHIPNSVFPPWRHLHFFRSFKKLPNIPSPFGQPGNARVGQLWWV